MSASPEVRETNRFDRLCVLLETIDELHAGQSGSLSFGSASQGIVLVQSGRVCWAASSMMPTRLTDRLRHACTLSEHSLQLIFRDCRASGTPFGETLVERGIVSFDVLRTALLQHNAETLLQLAGQPAPQWRPAKIEQYDPSLTFTSAELLAHSADGWWGPLAAAARDELRAALRDRHAVGLSFLRAPETADSIVPVGFVGTDDLSAREMLAIGRAAERAMQSCSAAGGRLVASTRADGRTTVIWIDDGAYYVAFGDDRSEMAFIVAHLSRRALE
ncbi:MAG: hypothetical protein JO197_06900 [Acidobacteria bacterium]|nr:hypothetical protein [Acidobacteriota bacterium]MBV9477582.1 hypothetical protein [Acidobacteriota bacterium]